MKQQSVAEGEHADPQQNNSNTQNMCTLTHTHSTAHIRAHMYTHTLSLHLCVSLSLSLLASPCSDNRYAQLGPFLQVIDGLRDRVIGDIEEAATMTASNTSGSSLSSGMCCVACLYVLDQTNLSFFRHVRTHARTHTHTNTQIHTHKCALSLSLSLSFLAQPLPPH